MCLYLNFTRIQYKLYWGHRPGILIHFEFDRRFRWTFFLNFDLIYCLNLEIILISGGVVKLYIKFCKIDIQSLSTQCRVGQAKQDLQHTFAQLFASTLLAYKTILHSLCTTRKNQFGPKTWRLRLKTMLKLQVVKYSFSSEGKLLVWFRS